MEETEELSTGSNIKQDFTPRNLHLYRKGIALSFISLVLLSIKPIISNSRPYNLSAIQFSFYLSIWQLICSLPLLILELRSDNKGIFARKIEAKSKKKTIIIMILTGIIFSFSTFFYIFSFEKAGTVSAAIAIQSYPLFSIFWESIFLKKKKKWDELLFTILIIASIYYIGTEGTFAIRDFSIWFAVALIYPFLSSIAHVTIKKSLNQSPISPNQVTFIRVLICSIILFIISSIVDGTQSIISGFINLEFQIYSILMGIVYYLELINWFYAVKYANVSLVSTITTPTPALTILLAFFFLNEEIFPFQITGMLFVFLALYGLIWRENRNLKNKIIGQ